MAVLREGGAYGGGRGWVVGCYAIPLEDKDGILVDVDASYVGPAVRRGRVILEGDVECRGGGCDLDFGWSAD